MDDFVVRRYLDYDDAAKLLGVCLRTLKTWCKQGRIPVHRFNKSRKVYFFEDEIRRAILGQESNFPSNQVG
jgi:excisionase family DNA binding protein